MQNRVTFDEVIATWLQDEWHYACFDVYRMSVPENVVSDPDFSDDTQNKLRREILMSNRGNMINLLPENTEWFSVEFNKEDIDRTFLIPTRRGWTSTVTGGSLRLKDALSDSSLSQTSPEEAEKIREIHTALDSGVGKKLLFVSTSLDAPLTVIEGNHRLIAIARKAMSEHSSDPILEKVYVGISPDMKGCKLHAH